MYNGELKTPVVQAPNLGAPDLSSPLNNEATMQLSQSLDSVNASPEDEVSTLYLLLSS